MLSLRWLRIYQQEFIFASFVCPYIVWKGASNSEDQKIFIKPKSISKRRSKISCSVSGLILHKICVNLTWFLTYFKPMSYTVWFQQGWVLCDLISNHYCPLCNVAYFLIGFKSMLYLIRLSVLSIIVFQWIYTELHVLMERFQTSTKFMNTACFDYSNILKLYHAWYHSTHILR